MTYEDLVGRQLYQSLMPIEGTSLTEILENYLPPSEQRDSFLQLQADGGALCGILPDWRPCAHERDAGGWNRVCALSGTLALAQPVRQQPYDQLVKLF